MSTAASPAHSRSRIFAGVAALVLAWTGIAAGLAWEFRLINGKISEIADLVDPSPYRAHLLSLLNNVNVNLTAYLQDRQTSYLDAVRAAQDEFEQSVREFEAQNARLMSPQASEKILGSYAPLRGAVSAVLTAFEGQSHRWSAFLMDEDQMVFFITLRLKALVRNGQPNVAERLELLSRMENQLRSIPKDLNQFLLEGGHTADTGLAEEDRLFKEKVDRYQQIAVLPSERRDLKRLADLRAQTVEEARGILALDAEKSQAVSRMVSAQDALQTVIHTVLPPIRPDVLEARKNALRHSIVMLIAIAGGIVLVGVIGTIAGTVSFYRRWRSAVSTPSDAENEAPLEPPVGENPAAATAVPPPVPEPPPVWLTIGLDGKLANWSPEAQYLYGYAAGEAVGKSVALLFGSETEIQKLNVQMRTGQTTTFDTIHLRKGGKAFPVRLHFAPVLDAASSTTGISLRIHPLHS